MEMSTYFPSSGKKLMGLDRPVNGYTGTVIVQGQPVKVEAGVTVVQGKKFLVSDKGQVKDESGQDVGQVTQGQFIPNQQPMQQQQMQQGGQL